MVLVSLSFFVIVLKFKCTYGLGGVVLSAESSSGRLLMLEYITPRSLISLVLLYKIGQD